MKSHRIEETASRSIFYHLMVLVFYSASSFPASTKVNFQASVLDQQTVVLSEVVDVLSDVLPDFHKLARGRIGTHHIHCQNKILSRNSNDYMRGILSRIQ